MGELLAAQQHKSLKSVEAELFPLEDDDAPVGIEEIVAREERYDQETQALLQGGRTGRSA